MGAISSGEYQKYGYGTGKDQIDLALQNRLAGRSGHTTLGLLLSQTVPSIFMQVGEKIGKSISDNGANQSTDEASVDATNPDDIKKAIDETLESVKCANISDVSAKLELARLDLSNTSRELASVEDNLQDMKNEFAATYTANYAAIDQNIAALEKIVANGDPNPKYAQELEELKEIRSQKQVAEEKIKAQEVRANDLRIAKTNFAQDVAKLEKAEARLKKLEKRLKEVEDKSSVENLTNNETKNFAKCIKELKEAREKGDAAKIKEAARKVLEAYDSYQEKYPNVKNTTLDAGYAEAYRILNPDKPLKGRINTVKNLG